MPDNGPKKRLYTKAQVAEMLDVSLRTIDNLIQRGMLNTPVDAGGPRWTERDIDDCIRRLEIEREAKKLSAQDGTNAHQKAKRLDKPKPGLNEG